jgi:hypothetical protein
MLSREARLGPDLDHPWPWSTHLKLPWTLDDLAERAAKEERALLRFDRFVERAIAHEQRPCGYREEAWTVLPGHDPWTFFLEHEELDLEHDWTLRILRRAGRACARRVR